MLGLRRSLLTTTTATMLLMSESGSQTLQQGLPYETEDYRPAFQFSPEKNWTNDPNGLVYFGLFDIHRISRLQGE